MYGRNALIVDDSSTARTVLKHQLSQYDIVVESACDGNHALSILHEHSPDVIFLDHLMPGLDGFQVLALLKSNESTRKIPVVMYTSQAAPQYLKEAKSRGAITVIPKNVTDEQLVEALNKAELYQLRAANDDTGSVLATNGVDVAPCGDEELAAGPPVSEPSTKPFDRDAVLRTSKTSERPELYPDIETDSRRKSIEQQGTAVESSSAGRSAREWLLLLLLAVFLFAQLHAIQQDKQQHRLISELQTQAWEMKQRLPELQAQIEVQQQLLSETNSRQLELLMSILLERIRSDEDDFETDADIMQTTDTADLFE